MISEHKRAARIAPYLSGWVRTLPEPGDVAAFKRGEFTVRLHGARTVLLTGQGISEDLRFYDAAARIADLQNVKEESST
jgi:hypothetical protein